MRTFIATSGFLLLGALPAVAQQPAPPTPVGIYVSAEAGALFQPQTSAAFGVQFGERIHRNVIGYATMSYFENVMSKDLTDSLPQLSQLLTARTGRPWDLHGRDRGVGFVAGAKYMVGQGTKRPYIGGGAGAIGIRRRITDRLAGDVTSATYREFGVGDSALTTTGNLARPLVEATLGVDLEFGRTRVDLGYRFRRVFHLVDAPSFSQGSVGIGVNF
jgi:hypothetical protein